MLVVQDPHLCEDDSKIFKPKESEKMKLTSLVLVMFLMNACSSPNKGEDSSPSSEKTPMGKTEVAPVELPSLAAFGPLPENFDKPDTTPAKVELGRVLYFENRLSKNQELSCNSCHGLDTFGADGKKTSPGHKGQLGSRNSQTVYNAAGHVAQFWDGRAADVEEQAKGPVLNPVEMAMPSEAAVVAVLKSIPGYLEMFQKAFPGQEDPITYNNMAAAIGAYERKLVTPSRWDDFLKGQTSALSETEKKGLKTFIDSGCTTCHNGPLVGGSMFMKLGLVKPWPNTKDKGRGDLTKNAADDMVFKVPSLRNISKTGPYFHDGSVATLDEAIKLMALHQVGRELTEGDVKSIAIWLETLNGSAPAELIKKPTLPESGPTTPAADPN